MYTFPDGLASLFEATSCFGDRLAGSFLAGPAFSAVSFSGVLFFVALSSVVLAGFFSGTGSTFLLITRVDFFSSILVSSRSSGRAS